VTAVNLLYLKENVRGAKKTTENCRKLLATSSSNTSMVTAYFNVVSAFYTYKKVHVHLDFIDIISIIL